MKLTSELRYEQVNVDIPTHSIDFYTGSNVLLVDEYTKYLRKTDTRYIDNFYYWHNDNIIGLLLNLYGEYTESELKVLKQLIQPGFITYDIGANNGYHTVGLASVSKHVYSFEPNEKNLYLLKLNTVDYDNVTILDYAVSDDIGMCMIQDYDLDGSGNYGDLKVSDSGQLCKMTTIDHLVETKQILPPNVVKIDVEGHEYKVIDGMRDTIKNNLPIIMYEHMHGDDLPKVYDVLTELGYEIYWFPAAYYTEDNYKKSKNDSWRYNQVINALALPHYLQAQTNLPKKTSREQTWIDVVNTLKNANN